MGSCEKSVSDRSCQVRIYPGRYRGCSGSHQTGLRIVLVVFIFLFLRPNPEAGQVASICLDPLRRI